MKMILPLRKLEELCGKSYIEHALEQPSHPNGFKSNKKFNTPNKTKTFCVNLYPEDLDMRDRYSIEPDGEILNGFVELSSNYSEDKNRFALTQLFRTKFSLIQSNNFEFIKREKRVLCTPLVPYGFKWNLESIKALCCQGKLHCRLKVDTRTLISEYPKNIQEEE